MQAPSRRRKRLSACRALHLHIHPLVQALVVEKVATGSDHPSRQALHIQRIHADHALHPRISCLNIPFLPARGQSFAEELCTSQMPFISLLPCQRCNAKGHIRVPLQEGLIRKTVSSFSVNNTIQGVEVIE